MECFNHAGVAGAGICKGCGKSVCRSCAKDLGFSIACSESCAKEAADLHEMNARGKKIYGIGATKSKIPSGAIVYFIMGAVFGGAGLLGSAGDEPQWFLIIMGIMFGSFGALAYRRAKDIGLQC